MSVTPRDRQRILELVDAMIADKSSTWIKEQVTEEMIRTLYRELPHITWREVLEFFRAHREELRLDAAVEKAEAEACQFIVDTLRATGCANLQEACGELALRAERGDRDAVELLEKLKQAHILIGDWIQQ
jgi:hypothetical protein